MIVWLYVFQCNVLIVYDIFSFKVPKNHFNFQKYCILTTESAILINFGTLSKPTYCLSESSWKMT